VRLFLDHGAEGKKAAGGWLQLRSETDGDPSAFRESVGTVPLSAALTMWSAVCPATASHAEKARYALATRLAVAQLPWLWNLHRVGEVSEEISRIAARTGWLDGQRSWDGIVRHWNSLMVDGQALYRLERTLSKKGIAEWGKMISVDHVERGTLVWQATLGFGVVSEATSRFAKSISVLFLKADRDERKIASTSLLPVEPLLSVLPNLNEGLTPSDADTLKAFLETVTASGKHLLS